MDMRSRTVIGSYGVPKIRCRAARKLAGSVPFSSRSFPGLDISSMISNAGSPILGLVFACHIIASSKSSAVTTNGKIYDGVANARCGNVYSGAQAARTSTISSLPLPPFISKVIH